MTTKATGEQTLTAALETRAQPQAQRNVKQLLERMKPEIQKALQSEAAVERLMRMYLTAIRLNPKLYECTDESLAAALLLSAQVDLEPGPLGHVYLVPYKNECTWILGYTGIAELARRSGSVAGLDAEIVWDCDDYRYWRDEKGQHFTHTPGDESKRKERLKVIVTWQERAGSKWIPRAREVAKSRIDRAKKASPAFKKGAGLWVTDEDTGWRKTGVRAVRAWLPLATAQAGRAFEADEGTAIGLKTNELGEAEPEVVTADVVIEGNAS